MPRSGRIPAASITLAVALSVVLAACSSSKVSGTGPEFAGFDELEAGLNHSIAQPAASLGVKLIKSGFLRPSGSDFQGRTAASSYQWRGHLVLIRQGTAAANYTLRGAVNREDVTYTTGPGGSEMALLPPIGATSGSTSGSALILLDGWLISVDIAPATVTSKVTLDDVKAFVAGLEL